MAEMAGQWSVHWQVPGRDSRRRCLDSLTPPSASNTFAQMMLPCALMALLACACASPTLYNQRQQGDQNLNFEVSDALFVLIPSEEMLSIPLSLLGRSGSNKIAQRVLHAMGVEAAAPEGAPASPDKVALDAQNPVLSGTAIPAVVVVAAPANADNIPAPANPVMVVAPASTDKVAAPASTDKIAAPASPVKVVAPASPNKMAAPSSVDKIPAPANPVMVVAPASTDKIVAPASPVKVVAPASPNKMAAPASLDKIPAPASPAEMVAPAIPDKAPAPVDGETVAIVPSKPTTVKTKPAPAKKRTTRMAEALMLVQAGIEECGPDGHRDAQGYCVYTPAL